MGEELGRVQLVEARLDQMDAFGQSPMLDVVVKAIPPQRYLALRDVFPDVASVRRLVIQVTALVPPKLPASSLGQIAFVVHSRMFDPDALDFEVGYLLTGKSPVAIQLSEERGLTVRDLPAYVAMAT